MNLPAYRDIDDGPAAGSGAAAPEVTVGVLLVVPEPFHQRLADERRELGDPDGVAIPPHITLLPPTRVRTDGVEPFVAHLGRVAARTPSFTVRLQGTDTFRPVSPVVFVRVARGSGGCDTLQQQIRSGPVRRPLEFPFHPHVTIAHNVSDTVLDDAQQRLGSFRADFPVTGFWLFELGEDDVWRATREFTLAGRR